MARQKPKHQIQKKVPARLLTNEMKQAIKAEGVIEYIAKERALIAPLLADISMLGQHMADVCGYVRRTPGKLPAITRDDMGNIAKYLYQVRSGVDIAGLNPNSEIYQRMFGDAQAVIRGIYFVLSGKDRGKTLREAADAYRNPTDLESVVFPTIKTPGKKRQQTVDRLVDRILPYLNAGMSAEDAITEVQWDLAALVEAEPNNADLNNELDRVAKWGPDNLRAALKAREKVTNSDEVILLP